MRAVTPYLRRKKMVVIIRNRSVLAGFAGVVSQSFRLSTFIGQTLVFFLALLGVTTTDIAGLADTQRANSAAGSANGLAPKNYADGHGCNQQHHNKQNQKKGTHVA